MFGEKLKKLRKERGITQEQLAAAIGVERSSIGKYEGKNPVSPSDDIKKRIAAYFNVSMDYLFDIEIPEKEKGPATDGGGARERLLDVIPTLDDQEALLVSAFVEGVKSSRKP